MPAFLRSFVIGLLLAPFARADFEVDHKALQAELAVRLDAFATWCRDQHLLAERDRICARLLALDPDRAAAHEALGHRRGKDGSWSVPPQTKAALDDAQALAELGSELARQRRAAIAAYRDAALALLDAEPSPPSGARDSVYATVLAIDPDDPEVRERCGEERYGNAWVLAETARAFERRPELRSIVADGIRRAGAPDVLKRVDAETALGVSWTANARTPTVRVFGTGLVEDSLRAAQAAHAVGDVFRRVFDSTTRHAPDFTIYLFAEPGELAPFLAALPDLSADERAFLAQLVGSGIPRTANTAQWAPSSARRLDGAVRHTLGMLLQTEFGITTDDAWAWEGLGLYLTRELVGTRGTWYIGGLDQDTELARLRADLLVQEANWMNAAYRLLRGPRAPDLGEVMRQNAGAMGVDGMLASYALCAYLLEGRPRELVELLFRVGRDEDPESAVQAALGLSPGELRERLLRWLSERRRPEHYRS